MEKKQLTDGSMALQEKQCRVITIEATEKQQDIKLRVAAYARVSSASDDQLNSFAAQNRYYADLISGKEDWSMVDIYPAILQEETMTSAIKKRNAKQVTTHITEAQKILRRLSGWTETKQIEQQVLGLLNMLLNNPERIQVVSPHPKSENVELQRQLDAVLSCQPIDEDAAQELIRSIASVQYSAIDADEYESIRLRRIFAQHPVMRELDAKLLKTTVSAIRVYSDKSIAIRLKNNQIIGVNHNERQSTQSHYDPCESGEHSTAGCPAAAASRRLLPGIYR